MSPPRGPLVWLHAEMVCAICSRPWVATYPSDAPSLECPGCGHANATPPAVQPRCRMGCGYPVAYEGDACGECMCEDDCAIW